MIDLIEGLGRRWWGYRGGGRKPIYFLEGNGGG